MEYWAGQMNWPLADGWKCRVCGEEEPSMTWGLVNGQCRCDVCHAEYWMRTDGEILTVPEISWKEDFVPFVYAYYQAMNTPISEWSDSEWERLETYWEDSLNGK